MTADKPDWLDELSALAAAGALTADERAAFDAGPDADATLAGWEGALLALAENVPPVAPPPALRNRLLAEIAPLPDGHTIRQPDAGGFRPTLFPGIAVRVLHIDRPNRQFACLMRIAPGARLPHHAHAAAEECVVLEGSIQVGGVRMGPGAYQRVEAGVDHVDQWSDTGATVYLNAPLDLLEPAAWEEMSGSRA
jgi:anti-sigma factor ChrR (cupin superfamily)